MFKLTFFFLSLLVSNSYLQNSLNDTIQENTKKEIRYDNSQNLKTPEFNQATIEKFKNDKNFNYTDQINADSWWSQFKTWLWNVWLKFWHWLAGDFETGGFISFLVYLLPYLFIFALVAFAIWLFYRLNPGASFFKSGEKSEVFFSEDEEIIKRKNIPELIKKAVKNKNYRLAVRYNYLLILKKLTDAELINYAVDKTNSEYFAEIASEKINSRFQKVTSIYEFIWYGNFSVTHNDYLKAQKTFNVLENQIPNNID